MRDTEPIDEGVTGQLPRFGLKWMFCLVAVIGIGTAWLLQPHAVCSVVVDFTELDETSQEALALARTQGLTLRGNSTTPVEDHCIRLRTPAIISAAIDASPELQAFAESKARMRSQIAMEWIYDNMEAVPISDGQIRVTTIGDAADKPELQLLLETVATAYMDYVDRHFRQSLTAVWADPYKPVGTITKEPSSWRVKWSFSR